MSGGVSSKGMQVFISYVREDARRVDRLQRDLEAAGIEVWRDLDRLLPGMDWRATIREEISNNSLVFIACFSRNSLSRVTTYQNEELILAVEQLRLRQPGDPWFIPARFDECAIPELAIGGGRTLKSIQHVDLFGGHAREGIARLVAVALRMVTWHEEAASTVPEIVTAATQQSQQAERAPSRVPQSGEPGLAPATGSRSPAIDGLQISMMQPGVAAAQIASAAPEIAALALMETDGQHASAILARLGPRPAALVLARMTARHAAELLAKMKDSAGVPAVVARLDEMTAANAADILSVLSASAASSLFVEIPELRAREILAVMPPKKAMAMLAKTGYPSHHIEGLETNHLVALLAGDPALAGDILSRMLHNLPDSHQDVDEILGAMSAQQESATVRHMKPYETINRVRMLGQEGMMSRIRGLSDKDAAALLNGDPETAAAVLSQLGSSRAAKLLRLMDFGVAGNALAFMETPEAAALLTTLPRQDAEDFLARDVAEEIAAATLVKMDRRTAATVLLEMRTDRAAAVLDCMQFGQAESLLKMIEPGCANMIRGEMRYRTR